MLMFPSCGSSKVSQPTANKQVAPSTVDFSQPLVASALRERAIRIIEESAGSENPSIRANAIEAAGKSAQRFRPLIERGLTDPNLGVRAVAAMTIGKKKLAESASRCRAMLDDGAVQCRIAAIFALAANGIDVDPTPLADSLLTDSSLRVRAQSAFILGELGNPSSVPLLRQSLAATPASADPSQVKILHLQIAEAMIKLGDDEQRTGVRAALYPSRAEELEAAALAAQILGQVRDRKSISQMVYLSEFKDDTGRQHPAEVRLAVADSLALMDVRGGAFIVDSYINSTEPAIRAQSAHAYGTIADNASLNRLAALMNDTDPLVRIAAADAVMRAIAR
jgi:HEAT repeat protein